MDRGECLAHCVNELARFDPDRHLVARLAPKGDREALFALFAFNLEVARIREQVREPLLGRMRLQWWRDVLEKGTGSHGHPVADLLTRVVAERVLPMETFIALLTGRERDLTDDPFSDLSALEDYSEATSATLLHLALKALGVEEVKVLEAGRSLGIAWGLIGIVRAVPFHGSQGRVALPQDLLAKAGLSPHALFQGNIPPDLSGPVKAIAETAQTHLDQVGTAGRGAPPIFLKAKIAAHYLKGIRRAGYDPFHSAVLNLRPPLWPVLARAVGS